MVFYFDVRRFLDIEYRTPNVEVFFPDTLKKNYDEERGRPEMSGRSRFLCARNEDEPEEKINNRNSAIYRGSANRLRMPDVDWPCP